MHLADEPSKNNPFVPDSYNCPHKSADRQKQKRRGLPFGNPLLKAAATYSPTVRSTIGDAGLNFSVRNGKRWSPGAIAT